MALNEADLEALVLQASEILDDAAKPFIAGHRAKSAVQKKGNDFATEVDLAIERQVVDALVSATGIEVHGEEFGGADVDSPLVWVLDPIDGTFNYAAGSPMAAILLGLVRDGEPVAGLTWVPFTGERFIGVVGKPLRSNGVSQPPLKAARLADSIVGVGTFNVDSGGSVPGRYRLAVIEKPEPEVLSDEDARCGGYRPRVHSCRNPRWGNQFQWLSVGPRCRRRIGARRRRYRHQPRR